MVISLYTNFLGISELKRDIRKFIIEATIIFYVFNFFITLTSTFLIIYALKTVSYYELGIIISVQVFIQIFLDYPTAILSDIIGHKILLVVSLILYVCGFIFLATYESTFYVLLVSFICISLAGVQETGAFESWFDTNYRLKTITQDPDRKIYSFLKTRFNAIVKLTTAFSFIIGGYLVFFYGLHTIWYLQSFFLVLSCIILIFTLKETNRIHLLQEKFSLHKYVQLLIQGVKFTHSNKTLRYMLLGTAIFSACVSIWSNYMLFPLFETYGKTEEKIGVMRASIWVLQFVFIFLISKTVNRIENVKLPILILIAIQSPIMFGGLYLTLIFRPELALFDFFTFLLIIFSFSFVTIPLLFFNSLSARVYLDVIPDASRTGVYSLLPTFFAIVLLIFQPIGAYLIEFYGFESVLLILLIIGLVGSLIIGYGVLAYKPEQLDSDLDVLLPFMQTRNVLAKELTTLVPMNSPKRVKAIVRNIRKELLMLALSDDKITDDEQALILTIMHDVKDYAEILDKILEDGVVTAEEKQSLELVREKLWLDSQNLIVKDDVMSNDEKKLLLLLAEFISNTGVD